MGRKGTQQPVPVADMLVERYLNGKPEEEPDGKKLRRILIGSLVR